MESIDGFIDQLPKVELHLHLVGSASVPTVLELARRHPSDRGKPGSGAGLVPRTAPELAAFFEFRDFPHFSQVYGAVSALVREPADVAELVTSAARDLAGQNVRYAELTVTPYTFTAAGMPAAEVTEALDVAARAARAEHGVQIGYIFDIPGEYGADAATATLDHALSRAPEALTGFGLGGIEQARPAHRDAFRQVFAAAIAAGLHSVPHAGEMTGPQTVGAGVGVALVPSLARTGHPQVRDLQITPQPTRYIGAWLPRRHQPNPAAERLITALRTRAPAKPETQPGLDLATP